MEEDLAFLKKKLLSLVVSSPTIMTYNALLKDYRSLVGGNLPVGKFGYRDPLQFIKERCTDIFLIEGPTGNPVLTPKITENLAHIDKMVQRQKVQSSGKHIGKRRSVFQPSQPVAFRPITKSGPPNRCNTPNNYNKKPAVLKNTGIVNKIEDVNPKINQDNKPEINQDNKLKINQDNNHKINQDNKSEKNHDNKLRFVQDKENDYNYQQTHNKDNSYESNDDECNSNHINNEKEYMHTNLTEEYCPSSALSKFYRKRLPQYNSDMDFPSPDAENNSKGSAESGRQSSTSSTSKQALLDEVKENIAALIHDSEHGVWCTDLLKLYKERFGHELRFQRFGHSSVFSLVCTLEERVCIARPQPDGDRLLQDPQRARPLPPARAPAPRRLPPPRAPSPGSDDALPGVDFEPDVFPEDCVHYLESIPAAPLEGLAAGAQLEVLVGEVYSPSHLWLLRVGPAHHLAMEALMDEMTEYYRGAGAGRVLACGAVRVGHYCASLYDNDWHRSVIVCIVDSDTVKVRHVDYGTVETVSVATLKPLRREWSLLPAQGIRARLAGCRPAAAGWRWSQAACAWLLGRVQDRRLYANVLQVDCTEEIVETFLIDTSGSEDFCLTRELIRVGHADRRADSALQVCGPAGRMRTWSAGADSAVSACRTRASSRLLLRKLHLAGPADAPADLDDDGSEPESKDSDSASEDCYLYPRFEALECGATPNYADICRMHADGIALDYVHAYRRHVPGPWARRPAPPPAPSPPHPPSPPPHSPPPSCSVPPRPSHSMYSPHTSPQYSPPPTYSVPPRPPHPTFSPHQSPQLSSPPSYFPIRRPHPTFSSHASPRHPSPLTYSVPLHSSHSLLQSEQHLPPSARPMYPRAPLGAYSPQQSAERPPRAPLDASCPRQRVEGTEVRVSSAEWTVLAHLRAADAEAARWYALTTAWRALLPPPPGL